MASPIWVVDSSSIILARSLYSREAYLVVLDGLGALVEDGRLVFPREVIAELERYAGETNPALRWAKEYQAAASARQPSFGAVAAVLAEVPEVLDPDKEGVEEADPYVLAMAMELRKNHDVRVVTEEFKTTTRKMPLGSAAGYLGIPSVSLKTLVKFEGIAEF